MENLLIQDVCEVYIKDINAPTNVFFFGLTSKNDVTQKIKQTLLKGGIGNGVAGTIQSEKEITFKVSTLLDNDSIAQVASGAYATSNTVTIQAKEVVQASTQGTVTIVATTPALKASTSPVVFDKYGKNIAGTWATKVFTATAPTDIPVGAWVTVLYSADVTGNVLALDSQKFPSSFYVELHTIAYDVNTNKVCADIYWVFTRALPDGNMVQTYEAGKQSGQDMTFTCQLTAGNSSYGNYVVVPRTPLP